MHKTVLDLIRQNQPITRIQIQRLTGIRLATITKIARELIESGFVLEGSAGPGNEKTKKKILSIHDSFYSIIGIDLRPDSIIYAVTDFAGNILESAEQVTVTNWDKNDILAGINAIIGKIISKYANAKFLGIGISCPATLDRDKKAILFSSPMEQLTNTSIKPEIEAIYKLPVYMDTSNNLNLLAEKWFGDLGNIKDVLYVELGRGIAVGIMTNGHFIKGYFGVEGEMGHTVVEPNGIMCVCGNRGCLETVSSIAVIENKIRGLLEQGSNSLIRNYINGDLSKVDIQLILKTAELGDKISINVLEEAAKYIGISVANMINLIGSQRIIFGGEAVRETDYFTLPIIRAVRANTLAFISNKLEFRVSALKNLSGALGAVALVLEKF